MKQKEKKIWQNNGCANSVQTFSRVIIFAFPIRFHLTFFPNSLDLIACFRLKKIDFCHLQNFKEILYTCTSSFCLNHLGGLQKTLQWNRFGALKNDDDIKIIYVLVFHASQFIKFVASRGNLLIEFLRSTVVNAVILLLQKCCRCTPIQKQMIHE